MRDDTPETPASSRDTPASPAGEQESADGAGNRGRGRPRRKRPGGRRRPDRGNRREAHEARRERQRSARAAREPLLEYPPELPVVEHREEIADAIRDHQVVVIAGETGSGKTTQIPKICLELGLGVRGMIGHTQP
ncbi:MAG TPA: hypothetical protein VK039_02090, partial [Brevibacterium sp.]|nr:hypothetical protein [Brevibacterium sp.]